MDLDLDELLAASGFFAPGLSHSATISSLISKEVGGGRKETEFVAPRLSVTVGVVDECSYPKLLSVLSAVELTELKELRLTLHRR